MKQTETTQHYIRALKEARKLLPALTDKLFASAIDVALPSYTPEKPDHVRRVSIPAELAEPVVAGLIKALERTLANRILRLEADLQEAGQALREE